MFHGFKETVAYYFQNQNPVFCAFLDSTKAFDRDNYYKLFKLLFKRELPLLIIRVLANLYMNNLVRISWDGARTDYFIALNGVKQGAVLSPILYCVYVDDLLLIRSTLCGRMHLHTRMTSFYCHLPLLRCANFSLYTCEDFARERVASHSMHLNPNVWLPYLRIVATLSKRSIIVFFTSTVEWFMTLFSSFLILAIWSHQIRMTAKILQLENILYDKLTIHYVILANYPLSPNIIY